MTPPAPPVLQQQVQQILQDLVLLEIQLATGDVQAFVQTLHDYHSLVTAVQQELFEILLSNMAQGLAQAHHFASNMDLPG